MATDWCDFHDENQEIKNRIVQECFSERLQRKAQRENLTLKNLLSAARAVEIADVQATATVEQHEQSDNRKKECFNCGVCGHTQVVENHVQHEEKAKKSHSKVTANSDVP